MTTSAPDRAHQRLDTAFERDLDHLLRCPLCIGPLDRSGDKVACPRCSESFAVIDEQFDLRPNAPIRRTATFTVGAPPMTDAKILVDDLGQGRGIDVSAEAIAAADLAFGNRLSTSLASHLEVRSGDLVLDLGCGAGQLGDLLAPHGIRTIGVDAFGDAPVLVDGHVLPFADETFDGIVTLAVLEHVRCPHRFMQEAARVLRPGKTIIGSSAFLEVFHMESHFHTTSRGIRAVLEDAGFEDIRITPTPNWDLGAVITDMGYLPVRGPLHTALRWAMVRGHRALWRFRRSDSALGRRATYAAGFQFVATKPGAA